MEKPPCFEPKVIPSFFSLEVVKEVRKNLAALDLSDYWEPQMCRHQCINLPFARKLHTEMTRRAATLFGKPVFPTYPFYARYAQNGILPNHVDNDACVYNIDVLIRQDRPWPIYVDDEEYLLGENEALVFSGSASPHYRNRYSGQFYEVLIFHFVPVGHKITETLKPWMNQGALNTLPVNYA